MGKNFLEIEILSKLTVFIIFVCFVAYGLDGLNKSEIEKDKVSVVGECLKSGKFAVEECKSLFNEPK